MTACEKGSFFSAADRPWHLLVITRGFRKGPISGTGYRCRGRRRLDATIRPERAKYRRSEVPAPQAASSIRDFRSKSGTRINRFSSAHNFPKFVKAGAAMEHELRKVGTSSHRT